MSLIRYDSESVSHMAYGARPYQATIETVREVVSELGFAVISCVLDAEECATMIAECWDFLEHITQEWDVPLDRANESTWKEMYKLYPSRGMLIQHWGSGHVQMSWTLRQKAKIITVFRRIWGVDASEDMVTSFDGFSCGLPPEITRRGWHGKPAFHTDQSYLRPNFECIQSWVTAMDVREGDATLVVLEGSHKLHGAFKQKFGITASKDWFQLNAEQLQFYYDNGCVKREVVCKAGDMATWDSRTIHYGKAPDKGRAEANTRIVSYMCMKPRKMLTEKQLQKKRKAFEEARSTTHWPEDSKLFSVNPHTYGAKIPKITPIGAPVLTLTGKKLAGF